MPKLLESTQIQIEFTDLDQLVPKTRVYDGPRSNGVHLSGVIKVVMEAAGLLSADDRGDMMPFCMCIGMAIEAWIVQLYPDLIWQPGEAELDGIFGSPDGVTGDCLEEIKATYMSRLQKSETKGVTPPPRNILEMKRWMLQLAGYCKMLGLLKARLHVCWLNGDYRGSGPQYFTYLISFTQEELDRVWTNMVLPNKHLAKAE